ncbi:MAG: hypothetical protein ACTH5W_10330 [Providencia sp.]|uniref:hypothetical protein n=1 Tax=Providencia sp. TaxID=589 RepID=UPI003F97870B
MYYQNCNRFIRANTCNYSLREFVSKPATSLLVAVFPKKKILCMKINYFDNINHKSPEEPEILIDIDSPKICRFCGKSYSEQTFDHSAHAISELIGNKKIFLRYECNDCNKYFSHFEGELAKFMGIERALSKMTHEDKEQFEHVIDNEKNIYHRIINVKNRNSQFINIMNSGVIKFKNDSSDFINKKKSYNKIKVFKAILKMALSMMPYDLLNNFSVMKKYLMDASNVPFYSMNIYNGPIIKNTFTSSSLILIEKYTFLKTPINENLIVSLQKLKSFRKNKIINFYFYIGPSCYQIVIPSDSFLRECILSGKKVNFQAEDIFLPKNSINSSARKIETETIFCDKNTNIKAHKEKWSFSHFLRIPVILENKKIKNNIPEEKNIKIDWEKLNSISNKTKDNNLIFKIMVFKSFYFSVKTNFNTYDDQRIVSLFEQYIYKNEFY